MGVIIEIINLNERDKGQGLNLDSILLEDIKNNFITYEQRLFKDLSLRNFSGCKDHLTDFCFELLDFDEEQQVYIARLFFKSVIIGMMKKQALQEQLHPSSLAEIFSITDRIDSFRNITEYLLYVPQFITAIEEEILKHRILIEHNTHVDRVLHLIDQHLTDRKLSVEWIARQVNLSVTHMNNLFKEHLEMTVGEYILERRINEIAYKLITSSLPIREIYETYGFVNHSHFIQRFKRIKGVTPLQYRKHHYP